jgi:hypothetical protein
MQPLPGLLHIQDNVSVTIVGIFSKFLGAQGAGKLSLTGRHVSSRFIFGL